MLNKLVNAQARIEELEGAIREYLSEHDTPAKDYVYRAQCRERLRKLLAQEPTLTPPSVDR